MFTPFLNDLKGERFYTVAASSVACLVGSATGYGMQETTRLLIQIEVIGSHNSAAAEASRSPLFCPMGGQTQARAALPLSRKVSRSHALLRVSTSRRFRTREKFGCCSTRYKISSTDRRAVMDGRLVTSHGWRAVARTAHPNAQKPWTNSTESFHLQRHPR